MGKFSSRSFFSKKSSPLLQSPSRIISLVIPVNVVSSSITLNIISYSTNGIEILSHIRYDIVYLIGSDILMVKGSNLRRRIPKVKSDS